MLIRDAAYWNRDGAGRLIAGDVDNAIDRLFTALEVLVHAGGLLQDTDIAAAFASKTFPFEKDEPSRRSQAFHQLPLSTLAALNDIDDGSFFVYTNPFIFHPIMVETPEYATNCAAVVLFNLGLAFHQRGRRADSRALYRARSFYNMSLALVETMSCQEVCANLKVAATNNKAGSHGLARR